MKLRNFRMEDELYALMQEKARLEGRSVSDAVRDLVLEWVREPPRTSGRIKSWKDNE